MGGTVRVAETGSIGINKTSFADTSAISGDDAVSYIQHQTAETITYMTEWGSTHLCYSWRCGTKDDCVIYLKARWSSNASQLLETHLLELKS